MCRMWRKEFSLCAQVCRSDECCASYRAFSIWIWWSEMFSVFTSLYRWVFVAGVQTAATDSTQGHQSWFAARPGLISVGHNWWQGLSTSEHCRYWYVIIIMTKISKYTVSVAKTQARMKASVFFRNNLIFNIWHNLVHDCSHICANILSECYLSLESIRFVRGFVVIRLTMVQSKLHVQLTT